MTACVVGVGGWRLGLIPPSRLMLSRLYLYPIFKCSMWHELNCSKRNQIHLKTSKCCYIHMQWAGWAWEWRCVKSSISTTAASEKWQWGWGPWRDRGNCAWKFHGCRNGVFSCGRERRGKSMGVATLQQYFELLLHDIDHDDRGAYGEYERHSCTWHFDVCTYLYDSCLILRWGLDPYIKCRSPLNTRNLPRCNLWILMPRFIWPHLVLPRCKLWILMPRF
jgi:hypothetical protein